MLSIATSYMMFGMSSCSMVDVQEGTKALCIKRPYYIGSDGVEVMSAGRHTIASSSTLIPIDTRPEKIKESFNDLTPKDETPVDFDIFFTIQKDETKIDVLYSKFGLEYYVSNLQQEFRELTRNKCKNYDMKTLTNDEKASIEICEYVYIEGNKIIKKLGIPVKLMAVNMGGVNPPDAVKAERSNTAASKQRELTIIQENKNQLERQNTETKLQLARQNTETMNQIERQKTEKERAKADKIYQQTLGLTNSEFMKLREIKVKEIGYSKANDITIIEGGVNINKSVQ